MVSIKAVIFDCDGTLVDSEYTHYLSLKHAVLSMGYDLTLEEYHSFVGLSDAKVAPIMVSKMGHGDVDLILQNKRNHYLALCKAGIPSIAPTVALLKSLAFAKEALGLKVGVCSAARKQEVIAHLRHLGLEDLLDIVLSGEDDLAAYSDPEGVNKPKPYIYQHAMKELAVSPRETVVIEDSKSGVAAGRSAGCLTIAVPNQYTRSHDLSAAHLQLESFQDFDLPRFFQLLDTIEKTD